MSKGYDGSSGRYEGYQQQQYGQSAQWSASNGYGQYGRSGAPAAAVTGYNPEQQAAHSRHYGY
ncbi:hypothetical protein BGZ52_006662, partial [Haplosporangium bisporale]